MKRERWCNVLDIVCVNVLGIVCCGCFARGHYARLVVTVKPMNIGLFRLMNQMTQSMSMMTTQFGMTESDLDELKELFTGTDWKWLALTFAVSILHSWFAFLAFKNDIGFWKKKSNLEGLSVRTQWSSFVCQLVIFLNLADTGQASTIILCEMGISVLIEGWKVNKFLARNGTFNRLLGIGAAPKVSSSPLLSCSHSFGREYSKKPP